MENINIIGLNFSNVTLEEATEIAINCVKNKNKGYVVTPNSEIAYIAKDDEQLLNIINGSKLVLPDGIGIIYAGKILKRPFKEKVAGVVFAEKFVEKLAKEKKSLFILGAKPTIAQMALDNLCEKYDGLVPAGAKDGYYKDEQEAVDAINQAKPDVLFVCLGCPRQEKFIYDNFDNIDATLMCGLGGSADVFSGQSKRAPQIFVKLGLEWFYRLLKEPKRIGRMMNLPKFMLYIIFKAK